VPATKELKYMKILPLFLLIAITGCTTIHYRSKNSIPVSFEGNPKHQKEVTITGHKHFYFWGVEPEQHEVFIDEEVRKAGYDGISKLIIYEQKNPQDILISFLTLGFYLPRGYTITGYASGNMIPEDLEDTAPPSNKK
jgi:hypothetical protein